MDRHAGFGGGGPERLVVPRRKGQLRIGHLPYHRADVPEFHAAVHLFHGGIDVVHGKRGNAEQIVRSGWRQKAGQPIVVGDERRVLRRTIGQAENGSSRHWGTAPRRSRRRAADRATAHEGRSLPRAGCARESRRRRATREPCRGTARRLGSQSECGSMTWESVEISPGSASNAARVAGSGSLSAARVRTSGTWTSGCIMFMRLPPLSTRFAPCGDGASDA